MFRLSLFRRTGRPRSLADWAAFSEAWWRLAAIGLGLRLLSFRRVERLSAPRRTARSAGPEEIARCVWAAGAASRHHLRPMHCLERSLCLRQLLGRRGCETRLRIGVAREESRLLAHAWVELEGRPVGETESVMARFEPLLEFEEAAASGRLLWQ